MSNRRERIKKIVLVATLVPAVLPGSCQIVTGTDNDRVAIPDSTYEGCTIFVAAYGDKVLFGNNIDDANQNTYLWATVGISGNYGVVYLGFNQPQGGTNEKGLCFDTNSLPAEPLNPHPELKYLPDPISIRYRDSCYLKLLNSSITIPGHNYHLVILLAVNQLSPVPLSTLPS